MKARLKFSRMALVLALALALVTSGTVWAITIVVDGDREAAWDGEGGQIPGSVTDPNEPGINDNVDIEVLQWTNDQTDFYFMIGVYGAAPLMPALAPVNICFDTDNSDTTTIPASNGIYRDRCSYDSGVTGIDTIAEAYRLANNSLWLDVFDATTDPMTFLGSGTLGYNPSATDPVVEMRVPFSLLGYGTGICPDTIPVVVYYDGGDTNPDDNLPDSGSIAINCGLPTAVTLSTVDAAPSFAAPVALIVLGLVVATGAVVLRRRK